MNPRERIATILFMEQLKRTKVKNYQGATYKELVLRGEKTQPQKLADDIKLS